MKAAVGWLGGCQTKIFWNNKVYVQFLYVSVCTLAYVADSWP